LTTRSAIFLAHTRANSASPYRIRGEVVALRTKRFTHLSYTWLVVELEHLKIKTRLTNEKFANVKGECAI
jgi:hypothetical protein